MTTLLLIISLILHAAGFYFITLLFMKYQSVKQIEERQAAMLAETEQSLTAYLIELKDENEKLITEMKYMQQSEHKWKESIAPKKSDASFPVEEADFPVPSIIHEDRVEISARKPETIRPKTIEDKVFHLNQKGFSAEEIAKQLNKGITEIELMLKFRQN
ncbi:DUF6115 domain-containing protein [Metabacillus idriensis]|uniref:DUF6115 domain-containing protein n=1 Tax=Metabacillus idriensis TaxID=324768 RepID=UPI00174E73FF|nr:Swarming motility protein SwrB [Metabacillus idriensis]